MKQLGGLNLQHIHDSADNVDANSGRRAFDPTDIAWIDLRSVSNIELREAALQPKSPQIVREYWP